MKIRFYQYSETEFTLDVKKWYGWKPVYKYGGAFSVLKFFATKQDGIDYLRHRMYTNPAHVQILEYPTIIIHQPRK